MSDLNIPSGVHVVGYTAFMQAMADTADGPQIYALTIDTVAPLIVAAELERLVNETDWAWAVGGSLLARAAELRRGVS